MKNKLYSVKETMDLTHLSRKQIFYYEQKALLGGVTRNENNNYRFYTEEQLTSLMSIKDFREAGFAIDDIKGLMENKQPSFLRQIIKRSSQNAKQELNRAIKQYEHSIESYSSLLEASYILENQTQVCGEISLAEIPERHMVTYEYEDYFFSDSINFGKQFSCLESIVEEYHLPKLAPRILLFENHFDVASGRFNGEKNKINLMYELSEKPSSCPYYRCMPAQYAVSAISVGNYDEDLVLTYKKLWQWAQEHGHELQNISIEESLLGPLFSHNETNYWISRVLIPLKK